MRETGIKDGIGRDEVVREIEIGREVIEENVLIETGIVSENGNTFTNDYLNLKQLSMRHSHFPLLVTNVVTIK